MKGKAKYGISTLSHKMNKLLMQQTTTTCILKTLC